MSIDRMTRICPVTVTRRLWLLLLALPLAIAFLKGASFQEISVHTKDSLSLRQGTYSSVFFVAEPARNPDTNLPASYQFNASGLTPPGMIFEAYPCNKPDKSVCSQVAASNGIFLDGTPTQPGSYTFTISVTDGNGVQASGRFTVVVGRPDRTK